MPPLRFAIALSQARLSTMTHPPKWLGLAFAALLVGCSPSSSSPGTAPCPQPTEPSCLDRTAAWCATTGRGSAEGIAAEDAGVVAVACPDEPNATVKPAYAVFPDGGPLDDAGVPFGCPSLGFIPTNSSLGVTDAGTLTGTSCCYPTHIQYTDSCN